MTARRRVVGVLAGAGAAAWLGTHAQAPGRSYRIGYLGFSAASTPDDDRVWGGFVGRLRELGFVEGRNLVIEQRFAEGRNERNAEFATEMVKLDVDVVVASSGSAARAVMALSTTLPIVTTAAGDPVRAGLVASLARPGGQLTGITNLADELVPKRLELLKAAVPGARRIAFARCTRCSRASGVSETDLATMRAEQEAAARSLGVRWLPLDVDTAADFEAAAAALRRERPDALLMGANPVNVALRTKWLALAAEQHLPMLAAARSFDAMLSYGPDFAATYRLAAEYVAKILDGARPGELPMQQPTKFEFVVNLKLAKAMGLVLPRSALMRADEVIE